MADIDLPPDLDSLAARRDRLAAAVTEQHEQVLADLVELARIPSISLSSFDPGQVRRSADAVAALLRAEGLDVEVVAAGGHPAVLGHVSGPPGSPRVLLYAHHDVQPPGDEAAWSSPPFEPARRGDRLFGRGVADDKAGVLAHVAAVRAHRAVSGGLPVDLTVIVEGEEEAGSATLPGILERYRDRLECDVIVLADSTNWAVGVPALTTTLRGNIRVCVTVSALQHAVHSGMYGGPVPDALTGMCRLLATLHDDDGAVAIEGLSSDDGPAPDYPENDFREDAGMLPGTHLLGTGSITSRLWTRPAVTVIGIDAPDVDRSANVLLPTCRAKVSLRTAPGEDPEVALDALSRHLRANAPWGLRVDVEVDDAAAGCHLPADGPAAAAARAAFTDAWGTPPVDMGVGGSIPFIAEFAARFPAAEILVTGVEDPDTRAHGADESLHLEEFAKVCLAEAMLLERLAVLSGSH